MTSNVVDARTSLLEVVTFETAGFGDRSYLVHDGSVGVVIDPQRDPTPVLETATTLGIVIAIVAETHLHNDYVSGGLALARETGARYVFPSGEEVAFGSESVRAADGAQFGAGSMAIRSIATPGHTAHHFAYVVESSTAHPSSPPLVFTGGSLLYGGVGRTDLLGSHLAAPLAAEQWQSVRGLLSDLDPTTFVFPTHGFGSFCSATPLDNASTGSSTIAHERVVNLACRFGCDDFVEELLRSPSPIPAYYRFMAPRNRKGADRPLTEDLPLLSERDLAELSSSGTSILDIRPRRTFTRRHHAGAINLEVGESLPTFFGWLVPFENPYLLVAQSRGEIDRAQTLLARIGRERAVGCSLVGAETGRDHGHAVPTGPTHSYPVRTFGDLADIISSDPSTFVLDVRHRSEYLSAHVAGAHHVAVYDLTAKRTELPPDVDIWVHCAAGFRAAAASSMLDAWGLRPILVDDLIDNADAVGLPFVAGTSA